ARVGADDDRGREADRGDQLLPQRREADRAQQRDRRGDEGGEGAAVQREACEVVHGGLQGGGSRAMVRLTRSSWSAFRAFEGRGWSGHVETGVRLVSRRRSTRSPRGA